MSFRLLPAYGFLVVALGALTVLPVERAVAAPVSVTITGNLQSELGCPGDFQPSCSQSSLAFDVSDDVWQGTFTVPSGSFNYFAALNGNFTETYGLNGRSSLSPIPLTLGASQAVKFYYDDKTKWVTDNVNTPIVVLAGNFQSELGCPGDFDSSCLRSWLQDKDGDGIYTLTTSALPPGAYETVVTINESFSETYGAGGVRSGANIPFTVSGSPVTFRYDNMTHVLQIETGGTSVPVPEPASLALLWSGVAGVAFARRRKRAR